MVEKQTKTAGRKPAARKSPAVKSAAVKPVDKEVSAVEEKAPVSKKIKVESGKYVYAVGRRKNASARVRLYPEGSGKITINDRDLKNYFPLAVSQILVISPLKTVGKAKEMDVSVKVAGGGLNGQAGAVRHGIARALINLDPAWRAVLKAEGFLTRDPRVKERKKPGLKRARRAPQWSKR